MTRIYACIGSVILCWVLIAVLAVGMAFSGPTPAPAFQKAVDITLDRLENIRVIDGDTLEADLNLGHGVLLRKQSLRLEGFDAWETSRRRRTVTITDAELVKGKLATEALEKLIRESPVACITDGGDNVYNRSQGYLRLVGRDGTILDVAEWMLANGHDRGKTP